MHDELAVRDSNERLYFQDNDLYRGNHRDNNDNNNNGGNNDDSNGKSYHIISNVNKANKGKGRKDDLILDQQNNDNSDNYDGCDGNWADAIKKKQGRK
ncbi:hypothetical protein BGZ65_009447 [Modicella reniformis]|uniref:Uncharacterized protein n=1 Tax=Modicella reniformis TaxID=1440133 RepID=A0A9P6SRW6_9FUNG|nr:hypothetical protein BGZ65_009447 [Modicella reniformis]